MLLILDNYDSFTYNLQQYFEELLQEEVAVFRNDEIRLEEIEKYDRIVLSPGPGLPVDAGILMEVVKQYSTLKPILGICLGHQAIYSAFGGELKQLQTVLHGVARKVILKVESHPLFEKIPAVFEAGRYHSWVPDHSTKIASLETLAEDESGNIMILKHIDLPVYGMQFHPESILTPVGKQLLSNWLAITR